MIFDNWADYVVLTLYSLGIILNLILLIMEVPQKKLKALLQICATVVMGFLLYCGGLWS